MASSVEPRPRTFNGARAGAASRSRVTVVTTPPIEPANPAVAAIAAIPVDPNEEIPHDLIATVAHELWTMHGGNDVLNWLEAERLLRQLFAARRSVRAQSPVAPHGLIDLEADGPTIARAHAAQRERALNGHTETDQRSLNDATA